MSSLVLALLMLLAIAAPVVFGFIVLPELIRQRERRVWREENARFEAERAARENEAIAKAMKGRD
jgi:NADH:ubiquinone oxidoreductase subunit 3 (subunit A)